MGSKQWMEAPAFRIDEETVTVCQAMEFLGSIPGLQHLPTAAIKRIAQTVQPINFAELLKSGGEPSRGFFIIWRGQLTTKKPSRVLKQGDFGELAELLDTFHVGKVSLLVLSSEHSDIINTRGIWDSPKEVSSVEKVLQLERVEADVFCGFSVKTLLTYRQVFGGQLVGQALAAASKSVNPFLYVHSLHSYFLRPGADAIPITYRVQRLKDGRNFANRFVIAFQNERIIFTMSASFQREEDGLEHQFPMPNAPRPEEVLPEEKIIESYVHDSRLSELHRTMLKKNLSLERPLDIRCCDILDKIEPDVCDSRDILWFRAKGKLSVDQALHRCVAAYATDWIFIDCALRPHGITSGPDYVLNNSESSSTSMLSLDHSLWFHTSIKADEWHLFSMESPRATSGRALVTGHVYSQTGILVMSATQEGLIRTRKIKSSM